MRRYPVRYFTPQEWAKIKRAARKGRIRKRITIWRIRYWQHRLR